MRSRVLVVLALTMGATAMATPAYSQTADGITAPRRSYRPIATRLEVYPSSRQVRRCVDWYQLEHRASGTVLTPQMRCWWARR